MLLLVVASMVGTGVFTTSGFTLAAVGSPERVLVCWLAGGAIALCGAIAYGHLAMIIPESGGEYLFLSRFVHPFAGFLAGWISLTAGFSGAIAVAAIAFEKYTVPHQFTLSWLPPDVVAVSVVVLCGLVHSFRIRTGLLLQNFAVLLQLVALIVFLYFVQRQWNREWNWSVHAWYDWNVHAWYGEELAGFTKDGWSLAGAMAISVVWISLSYAGFNSAIYIASEALNARRNVPRALIVGTLIVSVLYLVLNAVFVTAVPAESLAGRADVAAVAAQAIDGPFLEPLIRTAVAVGLLASVSAMTLTGPRVYRKMAKDGVFPKWFASGELPRSGIALQCALAILLIFAYRIAAATGLIESSLSELLIYLGATLSLSSAFCVATLFFPRVRMQWATRTPIADAAAGIYVVATLGAMLLMTLSHKVNDVAQGSLHLLGTAVTLAAGIFAYGILRWVQALRRKHTAAVRD